MNLIVVVFDCFIIFISLCCCPRRLSPRLAMEFVSLARSRRLTKVANLKGNTVVSNAGTSRMRNLIRKASSGKVGDDTNAKPSYSPAKESNTLSVSNTVTNPQDLVENEQRKVATPRFVDAGDLTDGDENVYGDVQSFIPAAPCIERSYCETSVTEQQVTSPMSNRYACPDDCDPYVWYGDVREYIAIHCAPPVIDYSLLKGSDFSSDSEDESGSHNED